jgi:hypothetical protein
VAEKAASARQSRIASSVAAIARATQRVMLPLRFVSNRTGAERNLGWLIPIAPYKSGAPSQCQSLVEAFDNEVTILLLVSPARCSAEIPPEASRAAFGLVAGRSLGNYAVRSGVSRNTVRNQLATVLDWMGIRRRTELEATIVAALAAVGGRLHGRRG